MYLVNDNCFCKENDNGANTLPCLYLCLRHALYRFGNLSKTLPNKIIQDFV